MPDHRINDQIRATTVRFINEKGEQVGIISYKEALQAAGEAGLDLVEVAPEADPPVCKLLDYGKFKYRQKKKRQGQKHHRARQKEIRIGMTSEDHDLTFKAQRVRAFLEGHDKVMISMRLRGRQKAHVSDALEAVRNFAGRFEDIATVERSAQRSAAGKVTLLLKPR